MLLLSPTFDGTSAASFTPDWEQRYRLMLCSDRSGILFSRNLCIIPSFNFQIKQKMNLKMNFFFFLISEFVYKCAVSSVTLLFSSHSLWQMQMYKLDENPETASYRIIIYLFHLFSFSISAQNRKSEKS